MNATSRDIIDNATGKIKNEKVLGLIEGGKARAAGAKDWFTSLIESGKSTKIIESILEKTSAGTKLIDALEENEHVGAIVKNIKDLKAKISEFIEANKLTNMLKKAGMSGDTVGANVAKWVKLRATAESLKIQVKAEQIAGKDLGATYGEFGQPGVAQKLEQVQSELDLVGKRIAKQTGVTSIEDVFNKTIAKSNTIKNITRMSIWYILASSIVDWINRYLISRQCLIMMPLTVNKRNYVAGINGHMGCVIGDPQGFWDNVISSFGVNSAFDKWATAGVTRGAMGHWFSVEALQAVVAGAIFGLGIEAPEYSTEDTEDSENGLFKAQGKLDYSPIDTRRGGELLQTRSRFVSNVGGNFTTTSNLGRQYAAGQCGRYTHDLLYMMGAAGYDKPCSMGKSNDAHPSAVEQNASLRTGNVVRNIGPTTINQLHPGMVVHIRIGTPAYKSGHFAVVGGIDGKPETYVYNESLTGGIGTANRSIQADLDKHGAIIEWAAMPKYSSK
jgi:hypothetical protein